MADYDKDTYNALRSLEVPRVTALALASEDSPLSVTVPVAEAVDDSVAAANVAALETKVNELLAALRAAGLMEDSP